MGIVFKAFFVFLSISCNCRADDIWVWRCSSTNDSKNECLKERKSSANGQMSLNACKLTCGEFGSLLPKPNQVELAGNTVLFLPSGLHLMRYRCRENSCSVLREAFCLFNETIQKYHPKYKDDKSAWVGPVSSSAKTRKILIDIQIESGEEYLSLTTNESYHLKVDSTRSVTNVTIKSHSFFGARHALETLSQLIDYDEEHNSLQIVSSAEIKDSPAFPYRSLLLDTSRNFISLEKIKKVLDGMAYSKLNTFHWHITDSHSFPLVLNSLPIMALFGAYSSSQVYHSDNVKELVKYARVRGIRIVPEFDAPAHVGHGWEWGEEQGLGKLVVCLGKEPWTSYCVEPPCGQMNLANENLYTVLQQIYNELADLFKPVNIFHYGGDEINLNCWNTSKEMTDWMTINNYGLDGDAYYNQWAEFQDRAKGLFTTANGGKKVPGIIWTSELTNDENLGKYVNKSDYIIQIWTKGNDSILTNILDKGYRVIYSNYDALYLDCGVASWVGKGTNWCSPYKGWQDIYDNDILSMATTAKTGPLEEGQVLGAEATLWTEQVDDSTVEIKYWPRGAALAERLWSNPPHTYEEADTRMLQHRHRLVKRGIEAARLQPEWCRLNEGKCPYIVEAN